MVGVNDKAVFYCHKCKQKTEHETDWESEAPNSLYIVCTVCRTSSKFPSFWGVPLGNCKKRKVKTNWKSLAVVLMH